MEIANRNELEDPHPGLCLLIDDEAEECCSDLEERYVDEEWEELEAELILSNNNVFAFFRNRQRRIH